MHVSSKSNSDSYTVAGRNSCARGYPGSCCHSHSHPDPKPYCHTNPPPNVGPDLDTYSDSHSCTYSDADAHPNAGSDPNSHAHPCSNTNAK